MDGNLTLFQAIGRKMSWLTQRQAVLSENVANADTPDFMPHDMKKSAFAGMVTRRLPKVQPTATHDNHLNGGMPQKPGFDAAEQKRSYETAPSGNAVVIEEQLIKVAETQMDYQTMSNLYRKHLGMIRTALGQGR